MALIYVTRAIPPVGIDMLREAGHEVDVSEKDGVLTKEELHQAVSAKPYEAVLSLLTDTIDGEFMDAVPTAKIIANYAVGYNNIDVSAATERGVVITNTPGVLDDTVSEFAFSMMLAIAKRISEADRFTRAGKYEGWAPQLLLGSDLQGKTLGIVGAGRIGSGVAKRAKFGLGMNVCYTDIKQSEKLEAEVPCQYHSTLHELLKSADVISIHVPLLESTKHLFSTAEFAAMKDSAYLINTSRGPVVDEVALVEALRNKTIRGAALDVFEDEPALKPGLSELDNVILTPHIASASQETRDKMSSMASQNIIDFLNGQTPANVVEVK